ncbi:hypothetical protein KCTC52924_01252 [Arenibacter antarcticus]|uniref:Outer membrane beta-barrel protein n=1 Tax=Arenibacter antarcticus TaxID=2040469 RepID=A0ABW5V9I6_9FLAO|nr:outer membrane beta-barrel protein [Arenibacter sp. H213]MCM4167928.1 hypothetical protein [Arenibacter sp. H213]
MNEDKIDKLFQEKLTDFQELPDKDVWRSIEASLDKKHRSRRVIPLWWKLGGVAAVLAILFFAVNPFSSTNTVYPILTDVENKSADEDANNITNDILNNTIKEATSVTTTGEKEWKESKGSVVAKTNNYIKSSTNGGVAASTIDKSKTDKTSTIVDAKEMGVADNAAKKDNGQKLKENPALGNKQDAKGDVLKTSNAFQVSDDKKLADGDTPHKSGQDQLPVAIEAPVQPIDPKKKSIFDEIEREEETIKVAEVKGGKWSAGPSVAPVYFNGIGGGSPINSILASNSKTGNVTLSYGVNVAYEVSKKVSIRSGIHKVDFGYNTNDVSFSSSFNAPAQAQLKNINYTNTAQSIVLRETRRPLGAPQSDMPVALDFTGKSPARMGTMGQQIGYLEVPLEMNYAILDSKFGVNLIGGLSSLFLTDNVVVLQSSGQTTELGEANNINSVNFSTNIGLGLNYKFNTKLKLNIEPVFKYHLNTFNDTSGNFDPYSLGVYSGFSFKF